MRGVYVCVSECTTNTVRETITSFFRFLVKKSILQMFSSFVKGLHWKNSLNTTLSLQDRDTREPTPRGGSYWREGGLPATVTAPHPPPPPPFSPPRRLQTSCFRRIKSVLCDGLSKTDPSEVEQKDSPGKIKHLLDVRR